VADEPIVSGMAGRYATALFDVALEGRAIDAIKADLDRFDELVAGSDDLQRLVRSPVFTAEEQKKPLDAILRKAGIGGVAANFVALVTSKRRLFAIREMIRAYRARVARHKGETRAEVTVAEPLSDAHLDALKSALKTTVQKEVALDIRVDPALLGGLIVKLGSRMVDASLKTKLNSIKLAMKEVQ
jgi:F-type H+-transporting ATPase subunit delta